MFDGTIRVTPSDRRRLSLLLETIGTDEEDREHLDDLRHELERAEEVSAQAIDPSVVTMNSRLRLRDLDDQSMAEYTLVYPHEADYTRGKISILAPLGTALLGYSAGDTIEWQVPRGTRRLRIESVVYQPEASGDLDR